MSGAAYPHRIVVAAPPAEGGGGSFDANDVWQPAPAPVEPPAAFFDSPAMVDDRGRALLRDTQGFPTASSDAVAFCLRPIPADLPDDAIVHVYWQPGVDGGPESDAAVMRVNRLENSLELRRV